MNIRVDIPNNARIVMGFLETRGFQAFVVGGAVRDSIIGVPVKDWDVATNATPEDVINIFSSVCKVIPTGIEHGTVTVMVNNEPIEVTTFRVDTNFSGGHSCDVEFVDSIHTDMSRRDFTMNAIAVNLNGEIFDPFNGVRDIQNRIIRFVGNAEQRIIEDPVRMMRGIRFEAQKNFRLHRTASIAIHDNVHLIHNHSIEGVVSELEKIIVANPASLSRLWEHGILEEVMPEVNILFDTVQNNPHHKFWMVSNHTIVAMENIEARSDLRWAMMFHDIGKAVVKTTDNDGVDHFFGHEAVSAIIAENIMRRMKMDNETINRVKVLVANHGRDIAVSNKAVKRVINSVGAEHFVDLIAVKVADDRAKDTSRADVIERIENAVELIEIFNRVIENEEAFDRSGLVVNGRDMMEIGFEGREIREVLEVLVERVIDNPELNNREDLMAIAHNWFVD